MKKIFLLIATVFILANSAEAQVLKPYKLSVPIPIPGAQPKTEITHPEEYIQTIYQFGVGIGALLAVAMIVFGAIEYTVSAGNVAKQSDARDRILNAIYGLALLLTAVLILYTINPALVGLRIAETPQISAAPTAFDPYKILTPTEIRTQYNLDGSSLARLEEIRRAVARQEKIARACEQLKSRGTVTIVALGDTITDPAAITLKSAGFSDEQIMDFGNNPKKYGCSDDPQSIQAAGQNYINILNEIGKVRDQKMADMTSSSISGLDLATLQERLAQENQILDGLVNKLTSIDPKSDEYKVTIMAMDASRKTIQQINAEIRRRQPKP